MAQQLTLRQARRRRGSVLTQEQLADQSGVDQTYISLIERGLRNPSDDIKARLAKALRIAPSRLRFAAPTPGTSIRRPGDKPGQKLAVSA